MRIGFSFGLALCVATAAGAASDRSAQEEIERELGTMVKSPAPQLELVFDGIDSPRFGLAEAEFTVDGQVTTSPNLKAPELKGQVLFSGNVAAGNHTITAKLTYLEGAGNKVFTYVQGTRFKLPGRWTLTAQRGLLLRLRTHVDVDDGQNDPKKRLELKADVEPKMLAAVDDGSLPPAPTARLPGKDAGMGVAAAEDPTRAGKKRRDAGVSAVAESGEPGTEPRAGAGVRSGGPRSPRADAGASLAAGETIPEDAGVAVADVDAGLPVAATGPSLDAGSPIVAVAAEPSHSGWIPWVIGGAAVLAGALWLILGKRRSS